MEEAKRNGKKRPAAIGRDHVSHRSVGDTKDENPLEGQNEQALVTERARKKQKRKQVGTMKSGRLGGADQGSGQLKAAGSGLGQPTGLGVDQGSHGEARATEATDGTTEPASKPAKRKAKNEIDSIFGSAKKKVTTTESDSIEADGKRGEEEKGPQIGGKKGKQKPDQKPKVGKKGGFRKTNDGLTVYTEDELGFGKKDAGGTPLCPFDCQCCF